MSSSIHIDNKGKNILILGKGTTQELAEHSLTAKKKKKCIQLILLIIEKNLVWACIILGQTVISLVMVHKSLNLKQKMLTLWQLHYAQETFQKTGQ